MRLSRRECLAGLTTLGLAGCNLSPAPRAVTQPAAKGPPTKKKSDSETPLQTFTPENFGAVGDGITNDTDAFAAMSAAVSSVGGGTVLLQRTTYVVGAQSPDPTQFWGLAPSTIMKFDGCHKGLSIIGNGARLLCQDGLCFGTFDPQTRLPTQHPLPFYGTTERSTPYVAMVLIQNSAGKVYVENLELDGNLPGLSIGGPYGDTGWQISAFGIQLMNNVGGEHLVGLHSHHHGQDGIYLDGGPTKTAATLLENVVSEYNGRQGCSVAGGSNYAFEKCKFNHTGRSRISSAPAAGVDIEAEVNPIRNLSFTGCEFSNNTGAGMVADSGDSDGANFDDCLFVGTTTWSAWPAKPHFRFSDCRFVGAMCHAYPDPDPARATQFLRCSFLDDPDLSLTKEVYGPSQPIVNLGGGDLNVLFDACTFDLRHALLLPWTVLATYNNCNLSQTSTEYAYPKGIYTGTDQISGTVALYSSKIIGKVTVNGVVLDPTDFATYSG
jgi:hypothetical protein